MEKTVSLASVAKELPRWDRYIRSFGAADWMRHRLAIDADDVHQECRLRALQALASVRRKTPELVGTVDETKIVNRAIARAFVDLVRRANRFARCDDEQARVAIQNGSTWIAVGTPSVEDDYLSAEYNAAVARACAEIRSIMGQAVYDDVIRNLDGDRVIGADRASTKRESAARSRAIKKTRGILEKGAAVGAPNGSMQPISTKGSIMEKEKHAANLTDDNLLRVALVYKRTHGAKVENGTRAHTLSKVQAINSDENGGVFPFPQCFGEAAQYDPTDTCGAECDFRIECAAIIPAHYDPTIETQLVQIRSAVAPVAKKAKPESAVPPTAPAMPQTQAVVAPPVAAVKAPKASAPVVVKAPKAPTPKVPPAKSESKRKPRPRGKTAITAHVSLSARKSTKTKFSLRANGERYFRLPQGSAAELAQLPVGTERNRDHSGYRYFVKKIQDGVETKGADGVVRKRDGVWVLLAKAKLTKEKVGPQEAIKGVEGSLGTITRFITGSNVWSASRFWSVIPPQLDPKHDDFDPSSFKPVPIYAYNVPKVVRPPTLKKKRGATKKKEAQK